MPLFTTFLRDTARSLGDSASRFAAGAIRCPALLIHKTLDEVVPVAHSRALANAAQQAHARRTAAAAASEVRFVRLRDAYGIGDTPQAVAQRITARGGSAGGG